MCKCNQTNDFLANVRKAYAAKEVLWQVPSGDLFSGSEDQAKERLENGKIECYIVPVKDGAEITFRTVTEIPKAKTETKSKK